MMNNISMFPISVSENVVNYFNNSESKGAGPGAGCLRKERWVVFHFDNQPDISARGSPFFNSVVSSGG